MKYNPHNYQTYATEFILEHSEAAVFLDMGLGKSVITLTAIQELCLNRFEVKKVLVIGPLRVARDTWPGELEKWDHLKGLTYSVVIGTAAERRAALKKKAHIYIINRENIPWLIDESGVPFDFDMVVIDELSSFKSYQAKRFRSLLRVRPGIKRIPSKFSVSTSVLSPVWIHSKTGLRHQPNRSLSFLFLFFQVSLLL